MAVLDLFNVLRTEYKPSPGAYLPIDMAKLAEKLNVRELGRERGRHGVPSANAASFDEIEMQITEGIRAYALSEERRTHDQLTHYEQRLRAADPHGIAADMRATATQSIGEFDAELLAAKSELKAAQMDVRERKDAVNAFKVQNRLRRPARPPKNHIFAIGILAALFLLETAPNALLFGAGDEMGFLGGYTVAILFSFLNLAFGFVGGFLCWPNTLHINTFRRIAGSLTGIVLLLLTVLLNLLVAHLRSMTGAGLDTSEATQRAWDVLLAHPFGLHDAVSIALAFVGVCFSLIALAEGFAWHDPYPGYTSVTKEHAEAEQRWSRLVDERLSFLDEVQKHHANELRAARGTLRDRQASIPDILTQRARLLRNFDLHIQHVAGVGRYVLAAYRDANRAAREEDHPVPAHFDEPWDLTGISLPETPLVAPSASDAEWKVADDALEASMEKLQNRYQDAVKWIGALDDSGPASPTPATVQGEA